MRSTGSIAVLLRNVERDLPRLEDLTRAGRQDQDLVVLLARTFLPDGPLMEAGFDPGRLRIEESMEFRRRIRGRLDGCGWNGRLTVIEVRRPLLRSSLRVATELRCARLIFLRPQLVIRPGKDDSRPWTLATARLRELGRSVAGLLRRAPVRSR